MSHRPIPFNDLSRSASALWSSASTAWSHTIETGRFILGPAVDEFERRFAEYVGAEHAIGVASGTDALELALRAVGVRPDTRVGLAANAGFYATCAVLAIGACPVYADVAAGEITPGPSEVAECIRSNAIEAFVITHLYGRLAREVTTIAEVCASAGVFLLEDCSQAHGARHGSRMGGTFGGAAAFSFYPTKNLGALGDAGAVLTSSREIDARVRSLRQYGWSAKYSVTQSGGRNSRLDELQAILLLAGLRTLDERNESRRRIVEAYLDHVPDIDILSVAPQRESWVGHLCVLAVEDRDALRARLATMGVATDIHFPIPDHLQATLRRPDSQPLPRTEALCQRVLSVPCFPDMTPEEVERVGSCLKAAIHG